MIQIKAIFKDNTTFTDKVIITTAISIILYGGTHLDEW